MYARRSRRQLILRWAWLGNHGSAIRWNGEVRTSKCEGLGASPRGDWKIPLESSIEMRRAWVLSITRKGRQCNYGVLRTERRREQYRRITEFRAEERGL
jgi:hypothetical protein